jgi:hypothetical protein
VKRPRWLRRRPLTFTKKVLIAAMILAALTAMKAIPADEAKKIGAALGAAITADRIRRGVMSREEADLQKEIDEVEGEYH